jgi:hypothetical protein
VPKVSNTIDVKSLSVVRIPTDIHKKISSHAKNNYRTVTGQIEMILREYLSGINDRESEVIK